MTQSVQDDLAVFNQECFCLNVRQLAKSVREFYAATLTQAGVNPQQLTLLLTIGHHQPIGVSALAQKVDLDQTTVTRNLKVLQQNGQIRLEVIPEDKRQKRVSLTEAGAMAIRQAGPLWKQAQQQARERWGDLLVDQIIQAPKP